MKKILIAITAFAVATIVTGQSMYAYAAPLTAQTWVSGTIKDSSNTPVVGGGSGDNVTVTCNGHVQVVSFNSAGNYSAIYDQSQCKVGDSATASVAISEGSGSNSGVVQNTVVNGPIVDLDVVVLDISVPEFGAIGAGITGIASIAGYMVLKAKSVLK